MSLDGFTPINLSSIIGLLLLSCVCDHPALTKAHPHHVNQLLYIQHDELSVAVMRSFAQMREVVFPRCSLLRGCAAPAHRLVAANLRGWVQRAAWLAKH